jgi:gamma-glutamylcyclotransferase
MRAQRVEQRGLEVLSARSAWVPNLALRFNKADTAHPGSGHANLVFAPGEHVEGVLYNLVDANEIIKMDPFEKAPWNYGRDALWVNLGSPTHKSRNDAQQSAWTYFANPAVQQEGLLPSQDYLDHLLAGIKFLSRTYAKRLQSQATSVDGV